MIMEGNLCVRSTYMKDFAMDQQLMMVARRIYCRNIIAEKGKFERIYGEELSFDNLDHC